MIQSVLRAPRREAPSAYIIGVQKLLQSLRERDTAYHKPDEGRLGPEDLRDAWCCHSGNSPTFAELFDIVRSILIATEKGPERLIFTTKDTAATKDAVDGSLCGLVWGP